LYPLAMATTLMYFGEHYLADALAGWAVVGVSFLVWNRIERRWDRGVRPADAAAWPHDATVDHLAPTDANGSEQSGVRTTVDV
jgi:hypothetical protein